MEKMPIEGERTRDISDQYFLDILSNSLSVETDKKLPKEELESIITSEAPFTERFAELVTAYGLNEFEDPYVKEDVFQGIYDGVKKVENKEILALFNKNREKMLRGNEQEQVKARQELESEQAKIIKKYSHKLDEICKLLDIDESVHE